MIDFIGGVSAAIAMLVFLLATLLIFFDLSRWIIQLIKKWYEKRS